MPGLGHGMGHTAHIDLLIAFCIEIEDFLFDECVSKVENQSMARIEATERQQL